MNSKISIKMLIVCFIFFSQISCVNNNGKANRIEEITIEQSNVLNYLIDTVLIEFKPYTLCGSFYYELNDSFLIKNIGFADSIFNEKDINYMLEQYALYKKEDIDYMIDTSRFICIDTLSNYKEYDFYKLHLALSPPLFSMDRNHCVIYSHAFTNKGHSDAFFIFEKKKDEWVFIFHFIPDIINFSDTVHYHNYSLLPAP